VTYGVYITHPEVIVDPAKPVPDWSLSEKGRLRAEAAALSPWAKRLGRIVSSHEVKAIETAEILARSSGVAIEIAAQMGENDRSATGFLPPGAFEAAADWFFAHPQQSFCGWERAVDAQARIVMAVSAALARHDLSVPIAFVGHGGVGTLLKCHLGGGDISRTGDQRPGGGNLFVFHLEGRKLLTDWIAMEHWDGETGSS
jgi:broad specificity phosphatase PhoE